MITLPIRDPWFRKLIKYAAVVGIVGGFLAAIYSVGTGKPISILFGDTIAGYWTGERWWILLTAFGGLLVAYLRKIWNIPDDLPGAIEIGQEAIIDRSTVLKLVVISAVSLIFGASLGPSYGLIMLSAGFGSWLYNKQRPSKDKEVEREYTRVGMSGGLGGVFSDPLLGTLFTMELSPSKIDQLASSLPRLVGAVFGYIVFVGITGATLLKAYELPGFEFRYIHLIQGALLGVFALIVLLVFGVVGKITKKLMGMFTNSLIRGLVGGAFVGFLAYFLPIAIGSGNGQLSFASQNYANWGVGFIATALIIKIIAISISQSSGFLGGNVFPTLFVGGIAGFFVSAVFPGVPVALAVSALMAAVPGATLSTPLSIILVAVAGVGLGASAVTPVIMAVVVAQLGLVGFQSFIKQLKTA